MELIHIFLSTTAVGLYCNVVVVILFIETVMRSNYRAPERAMSPLPNFLPYNLQPIPNADFIVPVEIDGTVHQVYVLKRPYVDEFLKKMGELYECVLFTASLAKYADPVADLLDK